MLTNDRERRICAKYSARDEEGLVHCNECPLVKLPFPWLMCKANSHYDRKAGEWVYDEIEKGEEDESAGDDVPEVRWIDGVLYAGEEPI